MGQGNVCKVLEKSRDWMRTTEIKKHVSVNTATLSRTLGTLFRQGTVYRKQVPRQRAFFYKIKEDRRCI